MCGQGDVEIIHDWRRHKSIDDLKRMVEERGYSAFTVSNGQPSFGHAALKRFDYVLTPQHCKPITTCCNHPCTIYIYTPPGHPAPALDPDMMSTAKMMAENDVPVSQIAQVLGVSEAAVNGAINRYIQAPAPYAAAPAAPLSPWQPNRARRFVKQPARRSWAHS